MRKIISTDEGPVTLLTAPDMIRIFNGPNDVGATACITNGGDNFYMEASDAMQLVTEDFIKLSYYTDDDTIDDDTKPRIMYVLPECIVAIADISNTINEIRIMQPSFLETTPLKTAKSTVYIKMVTSNYVHPKLFALETPEEVLAQFEEKRA